MKTENGIIAITVSEAFKAMHKDYDNVFKMFYPAQSSNGFTERNQTFFFTKNFLSINKTAICWQEVPFGENGEHIDTMIYLPESKSIIYVEAKRLKNGENGLESTKQFIENDIERLKDVFGVTDSPINERFSSDEKPLNKYILVLGDIWEKEGKATSNFSIDKWSNSNWLTKKFNMNELYIDSTPESLSDDWMGTKYLNSKERYHLLIGLWKI